MSRLKLKLAALAAAPALALALALPLPLAAAPPGRAAEPLRAGRVLVVANSGSAASLELASAYRRAHGLPPLNLVLVSPPDPINIAPAEFTQKLLTPVRQRLALLGERNVDYIVLCRDVPYRTAGRSVAAALMFDGLENLAAGQGYHGQAFPFDATLPLHHRRLRPTTMVAGANVQEGLALIRRAQVTYADLRTAGRFYLCAGEGPRGIRNPMIPGAVAALARSGARGEQVATASLQGREDILGQFTGHTWIELEGNRYLPGAILDNLTSFGGCLLDPRGQADLLTFVRHGVGGAYGTVEEPTNNPTRWADYSLPLRYAAGFNLMDAYLATVLDWQFGLVVGDPLMAPFAPRPRVELAADPASVPAGTPVPLRFRATTAGGAQSLAWVELWLNDQDRLVAFTDPLLPAGTTASLTIRQGDTAVASIELPAAAQPLPITALLAALPRHQDTALGPVEFLPTGRQGTRLLCRWRPAAARLLAGDGLVTVSLRLTLPGGAPAAPPQTLEFREPLRASRIALPSVTLDLGPEPPRPGDRLTLGMEGFQTTVECAAADTPASFREKLLAALPRLPAFGPQGAGAAEWRNGLTPSGPRPLLFLFPRDLAPPSLPPVTVAVEPAAGSTFGQGLPKELPWQSGPAWPLAETVLTVFRPIQTLETVFTVPPELCSPGWNRARVTVGTARGVEAAAEATFQVTAPGAEAELELATPRVAFRDTLPLRFKAGPALATAPVELLVDGRVAASFPPGSTTGAARLILPHFCPGEHQLQAQWVSETDRSPAAHYRPLARSAPVTLWIRHPLAERLELAPAKLAPDKPATLQLRGPYLREGLRLKVGGHEAPLRRDPRNSLLWRAELPPLPSGGYKPEITGHDPETETGGPIGPVLLVLP
ncbi:MAG: TIGR03790 family protein [Lentisphaeria bacterium]|jgi:uncharacterized protein (TIGR03790 family)